MDIKKWIGYKDSCKTWEYTYKDVILANLAFGAKSDDMGRIYSRDPNFRAIPTLALVPSFGVVAKPRQRGDGLPSGLIQQEAAGSDIMGSMKLGMDWDHDLRIHQPIYPIKGTLMWNNRVDHIWDRGPGKGCVISNEAVNYDEADRPVFTNYTRTILFAEGGFGGEPLPKAEAVFPDRDPDYVLEDTMSDLANVVYSVVCGGQAPIHLDAQWCREVVHAPGIILPGHMTMGYACRMLIDAVIPGRDQDVTRLYAQFRNPMIPGSPIRLLGWKMPEQNRVCFKVVLANDPDRIILNNCIFEWR